MAVNDHEISVMHSMNLSVTDVFRGRFLLYKSGRQKYDFLNANKEMHSEIMRSA